MANKKTYEVKAEQINGENITLPKGGAPVEQIEKPKAEGDAQLPVETPGAGAMPATAMASAPEATPTQTANGYTTNNETAWANGYESFAQYLNNMKGEISPNATTALTDKEYDALLKQMGITPEMVAGINKNAAVGTSQADETLLSDTGYALIQSLKAEYASLQQLAQQAEAAGRHEEAAQYRAQMQQVNDTANRVRAGAGYYGGTDGSMYVTHGELGVGNGFYGGTEMSMGGSDVSGSAGNATGSPETELRDLLEQWKAAAEQQANGQIDYAVEQAIKELERALEDAQPQFKEQAESVALAERQAMDNAALYAELRGDKGGIGQEQYSSIQNTAAQNHLAVQQAQTKLSTDTARQIEDLRAQGEFEKADKALEITQNYLAQLIGLEQWAAEYNLSVEQFQASLQQWEAEYSMAMQQLQDSQYRWEQEFGFQQEQAAIGNQQWQQQFDAALDQWQQEFGFEQQQAAIGNQQWQQQFDAALNQWEKEFGLDQQQYQTALDQWEREFALQQEKLSQNATDPETVYQALFSAGYTKDSAPEDVANYLVVRGMDSKIAEAYANQFFTRGFDETSAANGWGTGVPEWQNFFGVIKQYAAGGNVAKIDEMMYKYGGMMTAEQWNTLQKFFDSIGLDITGIN